MFRDCLAGRPYPQDTRENDSLAWLFSFQSCGPCVALSWLSFSRNPLILHLSLSLQQLNTKPNTIKFHKVQGTKLKQLQHFFSWNKPNKNIVVNHNFTNLKPFTNDHHLHLQPPRFLHVFPPDHLVFSLIFFFFSGFISSLLCELFVFVLGFVFMFVILKGKIINLKFLCLCLCLWFWMGKS